MKAAAFLVSCLENERVRFAFGIPGEENLELFDPITKWNARIESPDTTPEIVRKAFKLAEAEKPGSTHVELPENIADEEASGNPRPLPIERIGNPSPDRASLDKAANLIQKAERPIVLAGNGV